MKVFWSVGHDAKRKGAYSEKYKLHEYDICVELTQYCIEEAVELGLDCEKIYSDRLSKAIEEVNSKCDRDDLAIEVHINAMPKGAEHIHGCEVMYCVGSVRGEKLARQVQNSMLAYLGQRNCKNDSRDDLGWLEKTICTAIIPEPFFLSNGMDVEKFLLNDREANLRNVAKALATGVFAFIREEKQGR